MKYNMLNEIDANKLHYSGLIENSCIDLDINQRQIVEGVANSFLPLFEVDLSGNQIDSLFVNAEKRASAAGSNRTTISKATDVASKVNNVLNQVGNYLQDTSPVKYFDQKFEDLKTKITDKLGSDAKIIKSVDALGNFAKTHPKKTAFVIGVLTGLAGLSAGPAAGAIAGQVLRGSVELLKGEKLSTAVGKGTKTAVIGYVMSALAGMTIEKLGELWKQVEPTIKPLKAQLEGLIQYQYKFIYNGKVLLSFDAVVDPKTAELLNSLDDMIASDGINNRTINALKKMQDIISDPSLERKISNIVDNNLSKEEANRISELVWQTNKDRIAHTNNQIDGIIQSIKGAVGGVIQGTAAGVSATNEPKSEGVTLSDPQIDLLHEAILSTLGKKLSSFGKGLTTKITSDKLNSLWQKAGKPTDSNEIIKLLKKAGLSNDLIKASFSAIGVDIPTDGSAGPIPFKSGQAELDQEAEKIFKERGKDAFVAYWDDVIKKQELEDFSQKMKDKPVGTIISTKTGRFEKIDDKRWKNLETGAIYKPKGVESNIKEPVQPTGSNVQIKPAGTILSTDKGRFEKIDDKRWKNLATGKIVVPAVAKQLGLLETSSSGSTGAGSIASVSAPLGAVISRMPAGQSFFGVPLAKKKKKSRNSASIHK